jgi:hypothetical protein
MSGASPSTTANPRPLEDLTRKLLLDRLEHRRNRRPNTANLHLLINDQTVTRTSRASNHWISASMRGQDPPSARLCVDRQLEEALTRGPDARHLADVFGLGERSRRRPCWSTGRSPLCDAGLL